ncbi:WD repeat-containing protein 76, partial [Caerostris darwini]
VFFLFGKKIMNRVPLCDITTYVPEITPINKVFYDQCVQGTSYFKKQNKMKRKCSHDEFEENQKKNAYKSKNKIKRDSSPDSFENKMKRECSDDEFEVSEYEKMIQKNKDEKIAFLQSLKMDEVKQGLHEAFHNLERRGRPKNYSVKRSKDLAKKPAIPVRKSLRLAKVDIDLSEEAVAARAMALAEKEVEEKELPPILSFKEAITNEDVYDDFVINFEDLDFKASKPINDYVSHFKKMKIDDSKIAKVVHGRITAMAFHPMKEKLIVSVGNKYGAVGFWNTNSDSDPYEFRPHKYGITNLKFNPDFPNTVISSSYDGTIRCGDIEKKVFNEIFNISDEAGCTYFDFLSSTTLLVAQRNGNVSVVDNRSNRCDPGQPKTSVKTHQCHEYSVKSISIHPVDKNYFISADTKGFMNLWDLRKLQKKPLIAVHHHKRVIQSALFSPVLGNSVLTLSSDDSICLFDSSKLGKALTLKSSMKHNNNTGRWLSTFKATWLPNSDDTFAVGSMLYPRRIEIFNDKMKNIYNFSDEYFGCITSINAFHPCLPVLAGGNSSGKVYIFSET